MTDLSDLTDYELLDRLPYCGPEGGYSKYRIKPMLIGAELSRRLADLRAALLAAHELSDMNNLTAAYALDRAEEAEAERDRLREAMEEIARRFHTSTEVAKVVRAALREEKS